jgi:hypothetical protein
MRIAAVLALLSFAFGVLVFAHQPARASYDSECQAAGGTLKWDGTGLWWCCKKRKKHHTVTLWCKR